LNTPNDPWRAIIRALDATVTRVSANRRWEFDETRSDILIANGFGHEPTK